MPLIEPCSCRSFDDVLPVSPCQHVRGVLFSAVGRNIQTSASLQICTLFIVVSVKGFASESIKMVKARFKGKSSVNPSSSSSNPGKLKPH